MQVLRKSYKTILGSIRGKLSHLLLIIICTISILPSQISAAVLGRPPGFPDRDAALHILVPETERGPKHKATTDGLTVVIQNREVSRTLYNNMLLASEAAAMNWTGNHDTCNAGSTAQDFRNAVLLRLNYFRAMAGVPADVSFSTIFSNKNQQAALMMSANSALNHFPPDSWECYTADGAEAAGNSNIALGVSSWNAITAYMQDAGTYNSAAGHRRWILYPQTQVMGTGDIPGVNGYMAANTLWVFDSNIFGPRPASREEFVAWPPPGYVPYQVVFARWSFSYADADFSTALVSMTSNGINVAIALEPVLNGYGENTLVWIPMGLNNGNPWPQPAQDTPYTVTISNVVIDSSTHSFTYDVTVFDPATPSPDLTIPCLPAVDLLLLGD